MAMLNLLPRWCGRPRARGVGAAWMMIATGALGLPCEALAAEGATKADAPAEEAPPAQPPQSDEPAWERLPATRRDGFTAGLLTSAALGRASGYPLDLKKIGRERYYTQSDIAIAGAGAFWIGFSLIDWLSVGLGVNGNLLGASGLSGWSGSVFFRAEAFPLWSFGGVFREIGASLDAGGATALFASTEDDSDRINAGVASYIGGGAFYEGIRFWHVSTGPTVFANYMWSATVRHGTVGVGWRIAVYSGSVANKDNSNTSAKKTAARAPRSP